MLVVRDVAVAADSWCCCCYWLQLLVLLHTRFSNELIQQNLVLRNTLFATSSEKRQAETAMILFFLATEVFVKMLARVSDLSLQQLEL